MTLSQVLNTFFYLLIYPYAISVLGINEFGLFIFSSTICLYFMIFVAYGFDIHAAKIVSKNKTDQHAHGDLLNLVTFSKLALAAISFIIFFSGVHLIQFMRDHSDLLWICFVNIITSIFLPTWYFHGMQKMRVVTIVQLFFKIVSLPCIYYFVKDEGDLTSYAAIIVGANVLSAITLFVFATRIISPTFHWPHWKNIFQILSDVKPMFLASATNTLKQKSIEIIIGTFFGMREVAIYDLANKIYSVPSLLVSNINSALFPTLVNSTKKNIIKKIIKAEIFLAFACIAFVAIFGHWAVGLVADGQLKQAYPLSVLLSLNILTILIVGGHIYFTFIPSGRYDLILRNQVVSLAIFFISCAIYLSIDKSIYAVVLALSTSALFEIAYIFFLKRKL